MSDIRSAYVPGMGGADADNPWQYEGQSNQAHAQGQDGLESPDSLCLYIGISYHLAFVSCLAAMGRRTYSLHNLNIGLPEGTMLFAWGALLCVDGGEYRLMSSTSSSSPPVPRCETEFHVLRLIPPHL